MGTFIIESLLGPTICQVEHGSWDVGFKSGGGGESAVDFSRRLSIVRQFYMWLTSLATFLIRVVDLFDLSQRTRKILTEKIAQLNSAIDDVSSQLRAEYDANDAATASEEVEAAM